MNGDDSSRYDEARHALELLELGDAFLELDQDWRILRVNRNQEKLSQRPRAATLGRILWEVWPELANPAAASWREYHRCMGQRVPVQFVDFFEPLRLWTGVTAYPTSTGGIAVFFRDITEQKRAEKALRESDRRKAEFLGLLSHELRNPLVPIRNSVHVLGRVEPGSEQARRARGIIARQVEHIARMVEDLLDVRRISAGKLRLRKARMDLAMAVGESVEDVRPLFVSRGVALDLTLPSAPVWVDGDRTRVAEVLNNLLHNAAKFTDRGGRVSVTVAHQGGEARIVVRDDGVGVAPELLDSLFEPFVQGETVLHRNRGGLGLGLSLVRGIAELHGGSAWAESEGLGEGTTFTVAIPAADAGAPARREAAAPARAAHRRVLIIEDGEDAAESLRDVLEVLGGHEVHVARDGEASVEAARQLQPDVILCDLGLPGLDGYEVAQRVRDGVAAEARMVALSGYAAPEDVERALRAGFDYHLAKPPEVEKLLALIAAAPGPRIASTLPAAIRTGHHEVDSQHTSILVEAARLRSAGSDAAWESVRFLQHHTESHFAYEEELMEDVNFPGIAFHQGRHQAFRETFRCLREKLEQEGATPQNVEALATAVETWVAEHVLEADERLAEFIRRGRGAAA